MQFKGNLPKKHVQQLIAVMYVRVNWNEVLFGSTQLILSGKMKHAEGLVQITNDRFDLGVVDLTVL